MERVPFAPLARGLAAKDAAAGLGWRPGLARRTGFACLGLACLAALAPAAAWAQLAPATSTPAPQAAEHVQTRLDWAKVEQRGKLLLDFGGRRMTDERARSIAEAAGYTYLSWQTCAGVDNCILLQVEGKRGRIFQYVVAGERCLAGHLESAATAPAARDSSRATASGRRARRGGASLSPQRLDPAGDRLEDAAVIRGGDAAGEACFGGYVSFIRARQHHRFFIDDQSYVLSFEEVFQFLVDGRWTAAFAGLGTTWQTPVPGSGQTERGTAYEWRDAAGTVLAADEETVQFIASSGSTAPTLEQLCRAEEAVIKSRGSFLAEFASGVTYFLPIPTKLSGTASVEPVGVGGSLSMEKALDYYTVFRNTGLAMAAVASSDTYLDCLKNPGRYDPEHFAPEPEQFTLAGEEGFEEIHPEELTLGGNCPITRTETEEKELAGVSCTTTTDYVCHGESDPQSGESRCVCEQTSQEEVCTSGA